MPGWSSLMNLSDATGDGVTTSDATVAAAAVVALFILPERRPKKGTVAYASALIVFRLRAYCSFYKVFLYNRFNLFDTRSF